MKKFLIPFIIILALYIGYDSFTKEDIISNETEVTQPEPEKRIIHHYTEKPEVPNVDVNPLLGKYTAKVDNDDISATINIELMANKKIKHYRNVNRDGVITEGTVEGEYVIDGDKLKFTFPELRDKKVFPMEMLILKVDTDNNISSGNVNFVKS